MGILSFISRKPKRAKLVRLPSGSFTMDRNGKVLTSTLPQGFPEGQIQSIAKSVLSAFQSAKKAQMPLSELIINYSALRILARELRGGAIVFLMPATANQPPRRPASTQN
jgi:hypothetical protein